MPGHLQRLTVVAERRDAAIEIVKDEREPKIEAVQFFIGFAIGELVKVNRKLLDVARLVVVEL